MKYLVVVIIAIITLSFSCGDLLKDLSYSILIKNKTNDSIEFYFILPGGGKLYPDTTLAINKPSFISVSPKGEEYAYISIEYRVLFNEIPSDTLSIFVINTDTLNKYTWEEVRDGYMILKRYDLSLGDLEESNYTIIYP